MNFCETKGGLPVPAVNRWLPWLLAALLFALFAAGGYGGSLFTSGTIIGGFDSLRINYPSFLWLRQHLPFPPAWTESLAGGFAIIAESQCQALYPPLWPFFLISSPTLGFNLYLLAHLGLLWLGMFALCRHLTGSSFAAALGMLAYGACGQVLARLEQPILPVNTAWLPFVLLAVIHTVHRPSLTLVLCGGATWGFLFLSGHGQVAFIAFWMALATALYYARRSGCPWLRIPAALARAVVLPVVLGALLAAVQLVPQAVYLSQSARSPVLHAESYYADDLVYSPGMIATWLAPFLFGGNGNYWLAIRLYSEGAAYFGVIPLLMVVVALLARRGETGFWAGMAALLLLLAFGPQLFVQPILHRLPLFSGMLSPVRYALGAHCALGIVAALGAAAARREPRLLTAAVAGLSLLLAGGVLLVHHCPGLVAGLLRGQVLLPDGEVVSALRQQLRGMPLAGVLIPLAAALLAAVLRLRRWACAGLLAVALIDAAVYASAIVQFTPVAVANPPSSNAARVFHFHGLAETGPNRLLPAGIEDFNLRQRSGLARHAQFLRLMRQGIPAALRLSRVTEFRFLPPRQHRAVNYSATDPLLGSMDGRPAHYELREPFPSASALRLVSACDGVPPGAVAGWLQAGGQSYEIRAGGQTGNLLKPDAGGVEPVWRESCDDRFTHWYGAEVRLNPPAAVREIVVTTPAGAALFVAGLAVVDANGAVHSPIPALPAALRPVADGIAVSDEPRLPAIMVMARNRYVAPEQQFAALRDTTLSVESEMISTLPAITCRDTVAAELTVTGRTAEALAARIVAPETVPVRWLTADYPEWAAELDGEPLPLARADGMFQGMLVPPGDHRLVLTFSRRSLQVGLLLTMLTALTGILTLFRPKKKNRQIAAAGENNANGE